MMFCNSKFVSLFTDGYGINLTPCSPAVKGSPCNVTCTTPDLSQDVAIKCNGISQGNCGALGCTTNMKQLAPDITYFEIGSLSYSSHLCEWSCTYGINNSGPLNFTIYSKYVEYLHL